MNRLHPVWLTGLMIVVAAAVAAADNRKPASPDEAWYIDRKYNTAFADRPAPGKHPFVWTDAEAERARRNIAAHPWAARLYARLKRDADRLVSLTTEQLRDRIPDLPGSACSCPVCGQPSNIAWDRKQIDAQWEKPLAEMTFSCRGCKTVFPNAEYPEDQVFELTMYNGRKLTMNYYRGKSIPLNEGDRYFLSGVLREMSTLTIIHRLGALAHVCRISGEKAYSEAGRRILLRLAEVYPGYPPRIRNNYYAQYGSHNWEGKLYRWKFGDNQYMESLVSLYDAIYRTGVLSDEEKVFIENNIFREYKRLMVALPPLRDLTNSLPRGYAAMAWVGRTLGDHEMIDWVLNGPQSLEIFTETWFHRDGFWHENTMSYQNMAMAPFASILKGLEGYSDPPTYRGRDRFDNLKVAVRLPLLGKAYLSQAPTLLPTGFLPAINDSPASARVNYQIMRAARRYFDSPQVREAYDYYIKDIDRGGAQMDDLYTFEPGDEKRPQAAGIPAMVRDDRIFAGLGWGLFRSGVPGETGAALLLDCGDREVGHVHRVSLNFLYCDYGKELITDIGYLSAQHKDTSFNKSIFAHNTVIVNDRHHYYSTKDRVVRMAFFAGTGEPFRVMRGYSPNLVPGQTERFERTMFLVDRGVGDRYAADFFESAGGENHTYVIHGVGEDFEIPASISLRSWDPVKVFTPATGVKRLQENRMADGITGPLDFCWRDRDPAMPHTLFRLPAGLSYRFMTASAPGNREHGDPLSKRRMQLLMLRREEPSAFFAGVVEGFKGEPVSRQVEMLPAAHGRAMRVTTGDRVDLLLTAEPGKELTVEAYPGLRCQALAAAISLKNGRITDWMVVGGTLMWDRRRISAPVITGRVTGFDEARQRIMLDRKLPMAAVGSYLHIPGRSDGYYRITGVSGATVTVADTAPFRLKKGEAFRWTGVMRQNLSH